MRAVGILTVLVCGIFILHDYDRSRMAICSEYGELARLLLHIKKEISENMKTVCEASASFDFSQISYTRLGDILTDESGAWRERLDEMQLYAGGEARDYLYGFLKKFGTGTVEEELSSLSRAIEHFSEKEKGLSADRERSSKVRWVIYATAMSAFIILAF